MLDAREAWARSKARDADIKAWAWLPEELAYPPASDLQGPLAGAGLGVKDVIDVAGMPTRSGSPATSAEPARWDAACVTQLRAAGAVPIGKTVTAEFAYASPGPTRNPRLATHTPGGSSSGSAAAVAAGMVDIALGTQTGGSMIRPAAFCGVVGFKPTFGRVHRQGMSVLCDSLDTIGWFSRTVSQSQAVASVLLPRGEPQPEPARAPRVALLGCETIGQLDAASRQALDDCVARLQEQGATVAAPVLDADLQSLLHIHTQTMLAELARGLQPLARSAQAGLMSPVLREAVKRGLDIPHADYARLQRARERLSREWRLRFGEVDFIVTPSAPGPAPAGLQSTGSSVFNRVWSLLGWPALHLPTAVTDMGLPVGVQWVALPDQDHSLLGWAARNAGQSMHTGTN